MSKQALLHLACDLLVLLMCYSLCIRASLAIGKSLVGGTVCSTTALPMHDDQATTADVQATMADIQAAAASAAAVRGVWHAVVECWRPMGLHTKKLGTKCLDCLLMWIVFGRVVQ